MNLISGRSDIYAPRANKQRYFFGNSPDVYSDKLSELALSCNHASGGKVLARLEQQFDALYVDEVQDLAGYDLDILELFLNSLLEISLVGDHRQATLATNQSPKYKKYATRVSLICLGSGRERGCVILNFWRCPIVVGKRFVIFLICCFRMIR